MTLSARFEHRPRLRAGVVKYQRFVRQPESRDEIPQGAAVSPPDVLVRNKMAAASNALAHPFDILFGVPKADVEEPHCEAPLCASRMVASVLALESVVSIAKLSRLSRYKRVRVITSLPAATAAR